jgi:nucleoid-associated protein EbfC
MSKNGRTTPKGTQPRGFRPKLTNLASQAKAIQEEVAAARTAAGAQIVTGTAGGGAVTVTMQADGTPVGVKVTPAVVDPTDIEMLEETILAAFRDAHRQAGEVMEAATADSAAGLEDLGLGKLGSLLGL